MSPGTENATPQPNF